MRREWIEINRGKSRWRTDRSPSMRREWIEMTIGENLKNMLHGSPSMRREWIEIQQMIESELELRVSLHAEGVD